MSGLLSTLTEPELAVVRETERDRIAGLDEDALAELHTRVRRSRDKYVKLYRREASARVSEQGGRGKARPKNTRNAEKAEVFEDALARVSRQLAGAARHSATALRAERIAAARRDRTAGDRTAPVPATRVSASRSPRTPTSRSAEAARQRPGRAATRRRRASTLATGARRQARRDAR